MESSKRKPLSDITNKYNLIPTPALQKVIAAFSTSKSASESPISITKSNSSRSNTSIGSSNVSATLNSKKTVQFRRPPPSISSITSPGKHREIGKGFTGNSSRALEKTNDRKEGILKHSRSSTVKIKEIGQEYLNSSGFFVERVNDKGKPLNTYNSSHVKTRAKGKAVLQPSEIVEITESAKDKSRPLNTFNTSHEKTKEKGKANFQHSDIVEVAEPSDAVAGKSRPPRRKSEKRKFDAGASSCPPVMKLKSIQNDLGEAGDDKSSKSWTESHPKHRKKTGSRIENTCELPEDFIEQKKAYFKEIDNFELLEEEATLDELD